MFTTKRGKICIVIEQYKYSESNELQNGTFWFRWINKKCNVSVLTSSNLKNVLDNAMAWVQRDL